MIRISAPEGRIQGAIHIRGSKSISNRVIVLNHILGASPEVNNISDSEDTRLLQAAISKINGITDTAKGTEYLHSSKKSENIKNAPVTIDVHHAGADMRFLCALLSITAGEWQLRGSGRLHERPVGALVTALRQLGADIRYVENEGYPPLLIKGKELTGGKLQIEAGISSQFVSAILLIAPALKNGIELTLSGEAVSRPYILMTLDALQLYGIRSEYSAGLIRVPALQKPRVPTLVDIESDWSSASYWYSLCALSQNANITLSGFHKKSTQADAILQDLYIQLGVLTEFSDNSITLRNTSEVSRHFRHDFSGCPDIALTLAVTCFGLGIPAQLSGLQTLKLKESDRVMALKKELEKLGANVSVSGNSMEISGKPVIMNKRKNTVETYEDHRMAMSFAPLSLVLPEIRINDPGVVVKSYPCFWEDLKSLGFSVNSQPD